MKNLVWITGIGLALTLTACNSKDDSPKASTFSSYSGTVVIADYSGDTLPAKTWTGGTGIVKGYVNDTVLTSGTLNANGSFSLNLPTPADTQLETVNGNEPIVPSTSDEQCSNNSMKVSDANARTVSLDLEASVNNQDTDLTNITTTVKGQTVQGKVGMFVYSDRPTKFTGTMTCTTTSEGYKVTETYNMNVSLGKGWNKVTTDVNTQTSGNTMQTNLTVSSGNLPTDKWYAGLDSDAMPLGLKVVKIHK